MDLYLILTHAWRNANGHYHSEDELDRCMKSICKKLKKSIYEQWKIRTDKQIKSWLQNGKKASYYSCVLPTKISVMWSQRYLFYLKGQSEGDSHEVQIFDCYNDKSTQISIEKGAPVLRDIYYLSDYFGILVERDEYARNSTRYVISLIFLDLYRLNCKKLHTVNCVGSSVSIISNKLDPTNFVLWLSIGDECFARICQIVGTKLVFGDPIQLPHFCSYFKGCFYGFGYYETEFQFMRTCRVFVYNVEQQTEERFEVNFPEGYYRRYYYFDSEWVGDNVFLPLKSVHGSSVIARLNVQTRQWNVIEFATKNWIRGISISNGNDLIIHTRERQKNFVGRAKYKFKLYKISIRKPELLQNIAWLSVIKLMKKRKTLKGAYESARYCLPYNSFIRCPFAEPEEDEKLNPPRCKPIWSYCYSC